MLETVIRMPTPASAYAAHKFVWDFLNRQSGTARDFLFSVIPSATEGVSLVKVRSPSVPGLSIQMIAPEDGHRYKFSIIANPVRQVDGKVVPLRHEKSVRQWIERKLSDCGMNLLRATVEFYPSVKFGKPGHSHSIHTARITGELSVVDAAGAKMAMEQGIGRCKSVGYGLLELGVCHE